MSEKASNRIKIGIVSVLAANVINLLINLLTNFLLPKYLSVNSYAALKTYHLYIAYAGVLSMGFVDGMFLKYGGIDFDDLNYDDLNKNVSTFRIFQIAIILVTLLVVSVFRDPVLIAFAIATLPINMAGYFRSLYQAIGEFKKYSRIMNATTVTTFAINIILLFIVKTDNYIVYLTAYVLLNVVIWFILEYFFYKSVPCTFKLLLFSRVELVRNVRDGFLLMLGNFSNIILTSMDRWFIKALMATVDFAQYSFACSMENFVNVAVTPLTVTLYNYFCKIDDIKQIKRIRNAIIILGATLIACAYPGKFFLEVYLTNYIAASEVMFYLFAAQLFYIVNKSVYINLYKARHLQTKYFIKLILVIIAGFLLNVTWYQVLHTKEAFAIGTLISAAIWFIFSLMDFRDIGISWKEILFILINVVAFILFGKYLSAIIGFVLYIGVVLVTSWLLMRNDLKYLVKIVSGIVKKKTEGGHHE